MEFLILLLVYVAFGAIAAAIANSRGRNPVPWFFIGAMAPCLAIIILLVMPNPKEEQAKFDRLAEENRRLRETLRKDRMVSDDRHVTVDRRLTAHDRAAGIDTAAMAQVEAASAPAQRLAPATDPGVGDPLEQEWYWAEGQERVGPRDFAGLREAWELGEVTLDTLVWCAGMERWRALVDVPNLHRILEA